jgi:predicted NUDIX family NTP pyrophosphohydrolase
VSKTSAGLLLYRRRQGGLEVLVAHPGGPFFAKKDEGSWSIPKGLLEGDEEPLDAARREFAEETGHSAPDGPFVALGSVKLKSGKTVLAWACEGELDPDALTPGTFSMQWPPRSGKQATFPEIDRVAWLSPDDAKRKLNPRQAALVDRLLAALVR